MPGTPSCRQGGVSPCQWMRLGSSTPFSTRTRKVLPTSVVSPNVAARLTDAEDGGRLAVHLDVAPLQSEDRRSAAQVSAGEVCARRPRPGRVATPPAMTARRDSMGSLLDGVGGRGHETAFVDAQGVRSRILGWANWLRRMMAPSDETPGRQAVAAAEISARFSESALGQRRLTSLPF